MVFLPDRPALGWADRRTQPDVLGAEGGAAINSLGVIKALADAMCLHGIPAHMYCDNGPEMISKSLYKWVAKAGSPIHYIAPKFALGIRVVRELQR